MRDTGSEFDFTYDCDDFGSLYRTVIDELGRIGIFSAADYSRCREIRDYFVHYGELMRIEWGFANTARSLLEKYPAVIGDPSGISLLVRDQMPKLTQRQKKKALFLANTTTLIASPLSVEDFEPDSEDNDSINFWFGPDIEGCLRLAYDHHQDIRNNAIIPIPRAVSLVDGYAFNEEFWSELTGVPEPRLPRGSPLSGEAYEDWYYDRVDAALERSTTQAGLPSNVFHLALDGQVLGDNAQLLKLGIVLPSFDQVPIATVRKVRCDYSGDFSRFQRAMVRLSEKFGHVHDDERRLRSVLSELAEELNQLRTSIKSLKREHTSMAALTSLVTVVFYLLIQDATLIPQIERVLAGAASGAGTATMFDYFRRVSDIRKNIDANPFYFPLRLARRTSKD